MVSAITYRFYDLAGNWPGGYRRAVIVADGEKFERNQLVLPTTAGNGISFLTAQIHDAWTSVNDLK